VAAVTSKAVLSEIVDGIPFVRKHRMTVA
jgi:hypothetical protein